MRKPRPTIPASIAVALLFLLAGCGGTQAPAGAPQDEGEAAASPSDVSPDTSVGGAGGITAIDAAIGAGAALPADSRAPTAYDLARAAPAPRTASPAERRGEGAPNADAGGEAAPLVDNAVGNAN